MRLFNTFRNFTKLALTEDDTSYNAYHPAVAAETPLAPLTAEQASSVTPEMLKDPALLQQHYDFNTKRLMDSTPGLDLASAQRMAATDLFNRSGMNYDQLTSNLSEMASNRDSGYGNALVQHMKDYQDQGLINQWTPRFLRTGIGNWTSDDVETAKATGRYGAMAASMIPGLQPFATAAMLGGGLGDMKQRYDSGMYSMGTNDPTTGQTNFDWAGNAKRFGWDAAKTGLDVALSAAGYKLPAGQAPIGALERGMGYAAAPMNFLTSLPGKAIGLGKTYVPQAYNAAVSGAGRLATSIGESTGGQLIGKGMNALGQTAVGRGFSTLGRGLGYTAGAAGNVARGAANVAGQGFNALGRGVSHLGSQEFAAAYPRLGPALQWTGNTLIAKPAAQLRNATNFGTNLAVGGRKFLTKMLPEEYGVAVDMMPDVYKNFGQGTEGLLNVGEALVEDRSKSYLKGKAKEFNKYVGQQGQAARGEGDKNMYSNFRMYRNPNGSYSGFPYAMNDIRNAFRTGSRQFASGFAPSNSQWKVE